MYRRVVRSCAPGSTEEKPQTPPEVGGMIKNGGESRPDTAFYPESGNDAPFAEKPASHSLRAFLESQARHERISREIDIRNGLTDGEEE